MVAIYKKFFYTLKVIFKKKKTKNKKFANFVKPLLLSSILLGGGGQRICAETAHEAPQEAAQVIEVAIPSSGTKTVTGFVYDETGVGVPGSTITIKGSSRGVVTDMDGSFKIDVSPTDVLEVSFLGYDLYTVTVGDKANFVIPLKPKSNELDEVTVVAFGKQKKESVVSSITTVNMKDLKVPSSNLSTSLAGRIAGLVSYQRSGEPGQDDASFFVRGVTSLAYANGPMILIDGVEMTSADLSRMQPDDIASFSIMKDAAATALYGARGANGVILITTKEGKEGAASISFRVESSMSAPTQKVKLADPITYMRMYNEAVQTRDKYGAIPYSQAKIDNTANPDRNQYIYPANDWYDMLFNDYTMNYRANFNVSGGGKVARYYIAATYNQDNGMMKTNGLNNFNNNIDLKKYQLRSNVNINVTKTTEAVVRLQGTFDDYQGPIDGGTALYQKVMRSDPVRFPAYYAPDDANLHTQHILFGNDGTAADFINPYADMVKGYKEYSKSLMMAQFEAKQKLDFITEGLNLRGLFSTNRYSYFDVDRYYNPFYYSVANYDRYTPDVYQLQNLNPTRGTEFLEYKEGAKQVKTTTYIELAANYDHTFADKHAVSGLVVYTRRNVLEGNATTLQLSLPSRNQGVSGRATYAYDSRYFAEFNFGYNGSERFAERYRYGFFPSAGLGWIISNENFWSYDLKKTVSKLKLKGTYGLVGNDAIGAATERFFYLSDVDMNATGRGYTFGNEFGYTRNGIGTTTYANELVTWETSRKMNLGVELGLFDKIEIIADYYTENREGILLKRTDIPSTMGLQATPQANLGAADGKGIDLSVDYQHSISKDFWLTGRANFTYAVTKYTEYEEVDNRLTPWLSKIGQSVSQQWGYLAERLFVDDQEVANSPVQNIGSDKYAGGDIKYRDVNGDDKITSLDMVPIGYPTEPQIIYGFGLSAGYKSFDASFFFQGLAQESFWINTATSASDPSTVPFIDTDGDGAVRSQNALLQAYADNHWTEANKDIYALFPRFSDKMVSNNYAEKSTWFMRDGSFMRLKSAEIGYTLPRSTTEKVKVSNLRIYVSGTNLLTFSKFKLWDPEMAGNGLGYPVQRVFNLGLQISF
ncbi:SusC/RagA family TonB-linked outer membrane protein [Bacteroidia bacterium]|nr:SusC/RagA family TonB-linked outer membrane protein [Bacteroidia bacterium]